MPIYKMECEACKYFVEIIMKHDEKIYCDKCSNEMKRMPTFAANYKIEGDNSASVSPRGRNGKEE